jgi:hypothetical protein
VNETVLMKNGSFSSQEVISMIDGLSRSDKSKLVRIACVSAWNKDPVFGVIGIQSGPRHWGSTLASIFMGAEIGMLVVETIAKIRRAYFVHGQPIKAICRDLGVSRKVVRKVIRSEATEFRYERAAQPLPRIGPWSEKLDQLLSANEGCGATIKMGIPRQSGWECAAAGVTKGGRSPSGVTPAAASTPEGASFGGNGGW